MQRLRYQDILAVFIGGCFGGVARWGIGLWLNDADTMLGTTAVNLVGSFILAFVTYGLAVYIDLPSWLILALGTGFVGGIRCFNLYFTQVVFKRAIEIERDFNFWNFRE